MLQQISISNTQNVGDMSETKPLERQQIASINYGYLRQYNLSEMSETLTSCFHSFASVIIASYV